MSDSEKKVLTPRGAPRAQMRLVVIGSSTGGPQALQTVITGLPKDFPCPVVIVQHMPAGFTGALAQRLHGVAQVNVREAQDGELLEAGCVYIAPGNYHLRIRHESGVRRIALSARSHLGYPHGRRVHRGSARGAAQRDGGPTERRACARALR